MQRMRTGMEDEMGAHASMHMQPPRKNDDSIRTESLGDKSFPIQWPCQGDTGRTVRRSCVADNGRNTEKEGKGKGQQGGEGTGKRAT